MLCFCTSDDGIEMTFIEHEAIDGLVYAAHKCQHCQKEGLVEKDDCPV